MQNNPNQFSAITTFGYYAESDNDVQLYIYNPSGRLISTLADQHQTAGTYSHTFNAGGLGDGVYLYEPKAGTEVYRGKMVLLK